MRFNLAAGCVSLMLVSWGCSSDGDDGGSGGMSGAGATSRGGAAGAGTGGGQRGGNPGTQGGSGPSNGGTGDSFGGSGTSWGGSGPSSGGSNPSSGGSGGAAPGGSHSGGAAMGGSLATGGSTNSGGRANSGGTGGLLAGGAGGSEPCAVAGAGAGGGGDAGSGGDGGVGGGGEPAFPGCLHASYELPVKTIYSTLGCSLRNEFTNIVHVNVRHDSTSGWLVDFPDSVSAGPYALRETATGYTAGSTSATSGPLIGWTVDCAARTVEVGGISGDCISGSGTVQFSGKIKECTLWSVFTGSGRSKIGSILSLVAHGTCRPNPSYRFEITRPGLTSAVVQDWSPSDTFVWNTGTETMGEYSFVVSVRSEGQPDESVTVPYVLLPRP